MTLYAIFEPKFGTSEQAPIAVPEKFHWLAALLPPMFFVRHGLWLELLGFVLVVAGLWLVTPLIGAMAANWLYVLGAIWLGIAAPSIRRLALKRAGWRYRVELTAPAADIAQLIWLKLGKI